MRILLLNTYYNGGGAAIAASRMLQGLRAAGHDARLLVASPLPDDAPPYIDTIDSIKRQTAFLAERGEIFLANRFDRRLLFRLSTNHFGCDIADHPWVKWAEVIHLHWIHNGFLSLKRLRRLLSLEGKRLFWSLHDLAPLTGGCHIPYLVDQGETRFCDHFYQCCHRCPLLHSRSDNDLSRKVFLEKMRLPLEKVHFLCVSEAVAQIAEVAPITKHSSVSCLPNLYDPGLFSPPEERIWEGERKLIMVAARIDDPVKGFDLAVETLRRACQVSLDFAREARLILVGAIKEKRLLQDLPIPYTHYKQLAPHQLAALYRQGSLTLSTSRYETFGQTLLESIASGTPAVAFAVGGIPDIIKPERGNGSLIRAYDLDAMADALILQSEPHLQHSPKSIAETVKHLQASCVIEKLLALYQEGEK